MDNDLKSKTNNLPDKAGVYFFKDADEKVIYVGKAKNLKKRVKNHFQKPDQHAFDFVAQIADIDFILADTENAALILEQKFIKQLQPRWNVEWKDDKSYFYIALSADPFPRVYLTHRPFEEKNLQIPDSRRFCVGPTHANLTHQPALKGSDPFKIKRVKIERVGPFQNCFGPYVSGREVKSFLKEIRKILPYRSCRALPEKPCFYASLGLCAAPCLHKKQKMAYSQMIAAFKILAQIYQGKSGNCVGPTHASLDGSDAFGNGPSEKHIRIEGYDISNLSGTLAVGSMVVFQNGKPDKNEYRKFKIKTVKGQNDVASLAEILKRRMKHQEWPLPDLILLDGGKGQLKSARDIKNIPVLALAKIGDKDGKLFSPFSKNYSQLSKLPPNLSNLFLQIRDEAHRFAIGYNRLRCIKKIR